MINHLKGPAGAFEQEVMVLSLRCDYFLHVSRNYPMVFARWVLGIDFSRLSKVGTGGIEFFEKEEQISTAMSALEERLNESLIRIQNVEYFRGRKNIGVIPRGTRITFLSTPQGIDREYAVQYWVKVEINE